MTILFVAPMPPPITGNSLPVKVLYDRLSHIHEIKVINLSKRNHRAGIDSFERVREICHVLWLVWSQQSRYEKIYLTIAESGAGNLRDLLIFLICWRRLDSVVVHMFGGAGMRRILSSKYSIRCVANRWLLSKLGAIIVEGNVQRSTFELAVLPNRIHVVRNFALDELFVPMDQVQAKFRRPGSLRILFLSNMLSGKGHFELLDAFAQLDAPTRAEISLELAGKLVTSRDEKLFLAKLKAVPEVVYHGPVFGEDKRRLLAHAHIFCLPTYYPYEGQPFSILEAYAAGCCVITTDHSGIRDVFADCVNGFQVAKESSSAVATALRHAVGNRASVEAIAVSNREQAGSQYTMRRFVDRVAEILTTVAPDAEKSAT